jgi:hypothetical protein
VIIAAIYPVFLWFVVFRLRRTWPGLVLALLGTAAVWPAAQVSQMIGGSVTGGVIAKLVYGEMTLIGLVSLWLVTMRRPSTHPVCPYCRYNLTGLMGMDEPGRVCPECGHELNPPPSRPEQPYCLCCGRVLAGLDANATGQTCPGCGAGEDEFGNWTRAKAVRERAAAERARGGDGWTHGRNAR